MHATPARLRPILGGLLLAVMTSSFGAPAWPQETDKRNAGRILASMLCARCHAVDVSGSSPLAGAPPFRTLSAKYPLENLEESLAEGIVSGHKDMPEFELTPAQIDAFITYLRSVQRK